jgi:hypothetical protein
MRTADLIERLTENPTPAKSATGTFGFAIACGALVSFAAMVITLGFRPDLAPAAQTWGYWLKFFYPLVLAVIAWRVTERLARPGTPVSAGWMLLPVGVVAVAALAQWMAMPPAQHLPLLMGHSSALCPWRILALSLPLLAGTFWGMRQLAPTRPVLAGAAAGLFAGAAGAWIYAFACTETSMVFLAVWYTAGIALVALLGALLGRWALRW